MVAQGVRASGKGTPPAGVVGLKKSSEGVGVRLMARCGLRVGICGGVRTWAPAGLRHGSEGGGLKVARCLVGRGRVAPTRMQKGRAPQRGQRGRASEDASTGRFSLLLKQGGRGTGNLRGVDRPGDLCGRGGCGRGGGGGALDR